MPKLVNPDALRPAEWRSLRAQCNSEWDRVTVDDDGSFVIHNNQYKAQQYLEKNPGKIQGGTAASVPIRTEGPTTRKQPSARRSPKSRSVTSAGTPDLAEVTSAPPEVRPQPPEVQRPPAPARDASPLAREAPQDKAQTRAFAHLLTESIEEHRSNQRQPGVNVIFTRKPEDRAVTEVLTSYRGEVDWHALDLDASVSKLLDACRNGLPGNIPFTLKPEVLAVWGLDMEAVEAALEKPDRVEIRPESFEKTKIYPILGFYRGDVVVILGMRIPTAPQVIAVYVSAKLMHDSYARPEPASAGGGGAKRERAGLPSNPRQMVRALMAEGAYINSEILATQPDRISVSFAGQDLGQINVGRKTLRQQVESDYQRTLRKIQAIKLRQRQSA